MFVIGVAQGAGAQIDGCKDGPKGLPCDVMIEGGAVPEVNRAVCHQVQNCLERGDFPLVVGGDHSIAMGTWSAARDLGLIWIDAHMDGHSLETSPSKAAHGMPLHYLIEGGLDPKRICLIGTRSYEEGERIYLLEKGVRVVGMEEVRERGLSNVMDEALERVGERFGVSLDLDVIDPKFAPGVGSPEEGGLLPEEAGYLWKRALRADPVAAELVEYNPERDILGQTGELLFRLFNEVSVTHAVELIHQ